MMGGLGSPLSADFPCAYIEQQAEIMNSPLKYGRTDGQAQYL
jgi:hypothetical protein